MSDAIKTRPSQIRHAEGMVDPTVLMRIKNLELRAKVIVEGFWRGIHRSPFHGFSAEFTEYRAYSPGDDPRLIDWRVYARSDRTYIKRFEDETNLRCHLFLDQSRSMAYGSGEVTKSHYAATLAATLAYFLFAQGDAVGLATFDDRIQDYLPPRNRPTYLHRLMVALEKQPQGRSTDLGHPLQQIARFLTRRGLLVVISDLLTRIEQLESDLGGLCAGGHDVMLFHVLDPAEQSFDFSAPARVLDMETGRDMYVDPAMAGKVYRKKMQDHLDRIQVICRNLGIDYFLFSTDCPFDLALLDFLQHRMHRRKWVRRKGGVNKGAGQ